MSWYLSGTYVSSLEPCGLDAPGQQVGTLKIGKRRYAVNVQRHTSRATMGEVNYTYGFIRLATHSTRTGRKFRPTEVHDTSWHEGTHGILWEMGHRLYRDEKFVGQAAGKGGSGQGSGSCRALAAAGDMKLSGLRDGRLG